MTDKQIIRELAKRYMELANSEKQRRTNQRIRDTNDLKVVRPPVLIDEIPWYQMDIDGELTCRCEDPMAREVEGYLRRHLYMGKYFSSDLILDPYYRVPFTLNSTGYGWRIEEDILRTDGENNIVSHHYKDMLATREDLEKFHMPEFSLDKEKDERTVNRLSDLLGDAMEVKLTGHGFVYFMPWDEIMMLRGMEPVIFDFYDRPEHLHAIMEKLCAVLTAKMEFVEKHAFVDNDPSWLHCTGGDVSGLAENGWKATWFRGAAQGFSTVSPRMHEEFELAYVRPIAEKFAYTYYGCCEPLDNKMGILRSISNLRKVGVSPWANVEKMGEQLGGDYVFSRKPNPAYVASRTDPDVIRQEIEETVKVCIKYGCPLDLTLKDISTVSHRPENLVVWSRTVSDVLDRYYGE